MIRCPKCNAANKGRETCGACGAPLAPEQSMESRPVVRVNAGPREKITLTCRGCPSFSEEDWREPSGDGETYDRGTYHRCASGLGLMTTYGSAEARAPSNCPGHYVDSRAREAKQAEEIARLTIALAEAEQERDCLVEQVTTLRESALYEELQQVMKAHNATLVALAEAQAQAGRARNAALEEAALATKNLTHPNKDWRADRTPATNAVASTIVAIRSLKAEPRP